MIVIKDVHEQLTGCTEKKKKPNQQPPAPAWVLGRVGGLSFFLTFVFYFIFLPAGNDQQRRPIISKSSHHSGCKPVAETTNGPDRISLLETG